MLIRVTICSLFLMMWAPSFAGPGSYEDGASIEKVLHTKMALRDLWVEHTFWVRNYMLAQDAKDTPQRKEAEKQIVANAKALASSVKPFYGEAAETQLFKLLAGHWGAVQSYGNATFQESESGKKKAVDAMMQNAREIAKFLSSANPNLPENAVFSLLSAHGHHHVIQIQAIKADDFAKEAQVWAEMRGHMFMIADAIADALAKQFPKKFSA